MANPVRIGIIGCGSVMRGPYMNLAARLKREGKVELIAACDIDPARETVVKERFGFPYFSTNYKDILARSDVDLVLILSSMQVHGKIARAALAAGKHVLVEKPMAPTLEEGRLLLAEAQASDKILHCAPHVVLSPTFQDMHRRIQAGEIGKPALGRALYGWSGPEWGQWFYQKGGGPMFDLGVYNVTSLTALLGPAKRVTAFTGQTEPVRVIEDKPMQIETEDNAHVLMDHGNACFSTMTTGFTIQAYRTNAIEIYGTKGTIQMLGDDWDPNGFELYRKGADHWELHGESNPSWPWTDGLRHLVECIQQGTKPVITPEHAFHVLEIMIKANIASETNQTQIMESTFTLPNIDEAMAKARAKAEHDRTREEE